MSLKKNLDVVVYEQLLEKVFRGEWVPGQPISVDALTEEYGVSRTPILQALRRMEAAHMVEVTKTGHYSVPVFSEKDIEDLAAVRIMLEQQAIDTMEAKHLSLELDRLKKDAAFWYTCTGNGDIVEARKADVDFHSALVESAENHYLSDLHQRVLSQFMMASYLFPVSEGEQKLLSKDNHSLILEALQNGDFRTARERVGAHITETRDMLIEKLHSQK